MAIGRNPYFRGALAGASLALPVLAPAAAGLELANRAYDAGHAVKQFVQNPSLMRGLNIASQAAPGPYGEVARRALPAAASAAQFARRPSFGSAMNLAQHAPGPYGGYVRQGQQYASTARQLARALSFGSLASALSRNTPGLYGGFARQAAPALQRLQRRQGLFGNALQGLFR